MKKKNSSYLRSLIYVRIRAGHRSLKRALSFPLTETRARSELSAQCLKKNGFPLWLALKKKRVRARSFSTRALHKKKIL